MCISTTIDLCACIADVYVDKIMLKIQNVSEIQILHRYAEFKKKLGWSSNCFTPRRAKLTL